MFLIFYILFLLSPSPVFADSGHLVISEIQTYGQAAADEFVRLYNPTNVAVDISGWRLTKKTSSGAESNLVAKFADGATLLPNAYFLIAPQSGYQGAAAPDARYSGASYSIADNNTVILKNASSTVIDKVGFGTAIDFEGAPAANPEHGASIKRINNQDTDNNKNDFTGPAPSGTPNPVPQDNTSTSPSPQAASSANDNSGNYQVAGTPMKNSPNQFAKSGAIANDFVNNSSASGTPAADYSLLSIIEILPNPTSNDTENEYIKIHNAAENDLDLGGLYLDDAEGGSRPWRIPAGTIMKAGDDLTFFRAQTGLALNNDADAARILDKNKVELAAVEYENAPEGAIYIFKDRKWQWKNSASALAGGDKVFSASVIPAKAGIQSKNSITAAVIATPGIFGSQIMYVDGLQLYMSSRDWPELSDGDKIYAFGTPDIHDNEPRLKIKDKSAIKIISRGVVPEPASSDSLSADDLGRLIIIEGEVTQANNAKIILDVNGEEIPAYNKTKQAVFSRLKEKDKVQITGVASRYKDELRLLPRGADDIKIIKTAPAVDNKPATWQYIISTLAIGAFAGAVYIRRKKNGNTGTARPLG